MGPAPIEDRTATEASAQNPPHEMELGEKGEVQGEVQGEIQDKMEASRVDMRVVDNVDYYEMWELTDIIKEPVAVFIYLARCCFPMQAMGLLYGFKDAMNFSFGADLFCGLHGGYVRCWLPPLYFFATALAWLLCYHLEPQEGIAASSLNYFLWHLAMVVVFVPGCMIVSPAPNGFGQATRAAKIWTTVLLLHFACFFLPEINTLLMMYVIRKEYFWVLRAFGSLVPTIYKSVGPALTSWISHGTECPGDMVPILIVYFKVAGDSLFLKAVMSNIPMAISDDDNFMDSTVEMIAVNTCANLIARCRISPKDFFWACLPAKFRGSELDSQLDLTLRASAYSSWIMLGALADHIMKFVLFNSTIFCTKEHSVLWLLPDSIKAVAAVVFSLFMNDLFVHIIHTGRCKAEGLPTDVFPFHLTRPGAHRPTKFLLGGRSPKPDQDPSPRKHTVGETFWIPKRVFQLGLLSFFWGPSDLYIPDALLQVSCHACQVCEVGQCAEEVTNSTKLYDFCIDF